MSEEAGVCRVVHPDIEFNMEGHPKASHISGFALGIQNIRGMQVMCG